uniref:THAP-type domain-containing protein n=1 Tax=Schizaphis graminum TaxID=13262 RepID=A0A2S2PBN6_SCHGA
MPLYIFEGCNSGSRSKKFVKNNTVHLHKFPKDETLRAKWILQITQGKNIQNINYDTAVVCSKNFAKNDMIEKTELQKAVGYSPERARRLKEHAIPLSILELPYLCSPNSPVSKTPVKV